MIKKYLTLRNIIYLIILYCLPWFIWEIYDVMTRESAISPITQPKCQDYEGLQIKDFELVPENYSGFVKTCYNGNIHKLGEYKNGKHHGCFRKWDGYWIESEVHFKNGLLDGRSREWEWPEIQAKIDYYFKEGKLHGVAKEWKEYKEIDKVYEYGEMYLSQETPYNMGVIEGVDKHYYPEIKTFKHDTYKNGKLNGVSRTYWKGEIIIENNYLNDKLHGRCSKWDEDFHIEYIKIYDQGRVIDSKCWDSFGNQIKCH